MPQSVSTTRSIDERIADLLQGAIDPHVHSGPSIAPRGVDHPSQVIATLFAESCAAAHLQPLAKGLDFAQRLLQVMGGHRSEIFQVSVTVQQLRRSFSKRLLHALAPGYVTNDCCKVQAGRELSFAHRIFKRKNAPILPLSGVFPAGGDKAAASLQVPLQSMFASFPTRLGYQDSVYFPDQFVIGVTKHALGGGIE